MSKKFAFIDHEGERVWLIFANSKHDAIAKAVEKGFASDMKDFYYGYEDGQTSVMEITREIE